MRSSFGGTLVCLQVILSASFTPTHRRPSSLDSSSLLTRSMGLYDDPLPPRPAPIRKEKNNQDDEDEDDDDDLYDASLSSSDANYPEELLLFSFDESGKERRKLLPNLSRRLDSGVGCYFEPTDRKVQNLVEKTSCHVQDACWALEACKGDITEAWTCISTARRMLLDQSRLDSGDTFDMDVYELEVEEEYEDLKESRLKEQKKRDRQDFFKGGDPDQQWLPRANPRPVDDEPWFTG